MRRGGGPDDRVPPLMPSDEQFARMPGCRPSWFISVDIVTPGCGLTPGSSWRRSAPGPRRGSQVCGPWHRRRLAVVEVDPDHCPNGHELGPNMVTKGAALPVRRGSQRASHLVLPDVRGGKCTNRRTARRDRSAS